MINLLLTVVAILPNNYNDNVYAKAYNQALKENKPLVIWINEIPSYKSSDQITISLFNQDIFPDVLEGIIVATPNGKGGFVRKDYKNDQEYRKGTNKSVLSSC